jgi:acyl-coenzyme A thioesterase PaaI-like protein
VARFTPAPHHCSAPIHFVNGGIIATLIDCHCICTAMAAAYFAEGRPIGSEPHRYFATGSLQIGYRRPTPMDTVLELSAVVHERQDERCRLTCQLSVQGKLCAVGDVLAVPVSEAWMGISPKP